MQKNRFQNTELPYDLRKKNGDTELPSSLTIDLQTQDQKGSSFSTVYEQFNLTNHIGESHYHLPATAIGLKWKVRVIIPPWNLTSKESYSTIKKPFALAF